MKKLLVALVTTTCLFSSTTYAAAQDSIVASYKNGEVKASQVMDFLTSRAPQFKGKKLSEFNPNVQSALIKEYVYSQITPIEAKATGIENTKEFKKKLAAAKLELARQEIVSDYVKKHYKDDMINKEYDALVANLNGKDEMKVWQILVPTAKEAEDIKKEILNSKSNFATAAQKLLDAEEERLKNVKDKDKERRISGGLIGFFMQGQTPPDFDKEIFKYKEGDTAIIETSLGHHVVFIEKRQKIKIPAKESIKDSLKQQIEARLMQDYYKSLDDKYEVTVTAVTPEVPSETK